MAFELERPDRAPDVPAGRERERILAPRVGRIASVDAAGRVMVDFPGNAAGPVAARSLLGTTPEDLARAAEARHPVVLLFEDGDPALPLLVGIVASSTPLLDAVLARAPAAAPAARAPSPAPGAAADAEDPCRSLDARDELVLRCGKSSITLRANGKIVVRGTYVETRADGTNRIKGGTVKIN